MFKTKTFIFFEIQTKFFWSKNQISWKFQNLKMQNAWIGKKRKSWTVELLVSNPGFDEGLGSNPVMSERVG